MWRGPVTSASDVFLPLLFCLFAAAAASALALASAASALAFFASASAIALGSVSSNLVSPGRLMGGGAPGCVHPQALVSARAACLTLTCTCLSCGIFFHFGKGRHPGLAVL